MEGGRATLGHILGGRSGALEPACLSRQDYLVVPVAEHTEYWILLSHTMAHTHTFPETPPLSMSPVQSKLLAGHLYLGTRWSLQTQRGQTGLVFLPPNPFFFLLSNTIISFVTPSFVHASSQAGKLRAVLECPFGPLGNPRGPSGLSSLPLLLG